MAKLKLTDSVWNILYEGFKIYFRYIGQFTKYMLFPVLGQVLGIILIIGLTTWFATSIPMLLEKFYIFNNITVVFLTILLITIPGFIIFLKAFWDYLVAYGALNSMTSAILTTGKLYDIKAHNQTVTNNSLKFIGLLCVISIFMLIAVNPLFWILGMIFFIYFILVFQVFSFEENASVLECFKRSLQLVKGNFARTLAILMVLVLVTHFLLYSGISVLLDVIKVSIPIKSVFEYWVMTLPLEDVNITLATYKLPTITALSVATQILSSTILFIVTGLTLPLRSVCWSLWYKNLAKKEVVKK